VAESDVKLLAPITNPPKMLAAWVNNVPEGEKPPYKQPIFFAKYATSIIGPGDNIVLPACTKNVVVEPELTVIIGKGGRYIKEEDALSHVAGYSIVNDVTSFNHRLVDLMDSRGPNMMAKIFDTFAPTGPYIVTSDEVGDPGNLQVRQWLNDELKTDNNTRNYLIGVPAFISYLSSFLTLEVGDMILMGSFRPLAELTFLSPGDQVRIEIEKVGVQENPVVAEG
jgi:2-keto-4-pentenoate hydratase/2-oxohepta-3-ene-1,7-dioic acid hydratase in catechol pathway